VAVVPVVEAVLVGSLVEQLAVVPVAAEPVELALV